MNLWHSILGLLALDTTAYLLSSCIVAFAIYETFRFAHSIAPLNSSLRSANNLLFKFKTEEDFQAGFTTFSQNTSRIDLLAHQWHEFSETLIPKEDAVYNVMDAETFFSTDQIYGNKIHIDRFLQLPNLLAGLGILGTFLGLLGGISSVSNNLTESGITGLLNGASVAFMTSIAGIGCSICFSFFLRAQIQSFEQLRVKWVSGLDSRLRRLTPETVAFRTLESQEKVAVALENFSKTFDVGNQNGFLALQREQLSILTRIDDSLSEVYNNSVLSQMKETQNIIRSGFDDFGSRLDVFYQELANNSSQAIIEALEQVVKDFNKNLNEQFGDNFKQLNSAVEKMVLWQDKYKDHLEQIDAQFEKSISAIDEVGKALALIKKEVENFPEPARQMGIEIEFFGTQIQTISKLHHSLQESVNSASKTTLQTCASLEKLNDSVVKGTAEYHAHLLNSNEQIDMIVATHQESLSAILAGTNKFREESLNILEKGFKEIDSGLEQELTNSLATLGSSLAVLSEKFVEDYKPLTEKLQKILDISRELE